MSDNVVKVAAEELKKWLDVLQQLIKEKQAYDAKQAAKIDKAEMRQLQEMRHEQMMAKFDKLANNGGEVSELKKAVEEAQKEIQSLRKQLEGPDELEVDGEVNEVEQQKLEQEKLAQQKLEQEKLAQQKLEQEKLAQQKLEQDKLAQKELKQPGAPANDLNADQEKVGEMKLPGQKPKTGTDIGREKGAEGKWQRAEPKKEIKNGLGAPKPEIGKHRMAVGGGGGGGFGKM